MNPTLAAWMSRLPWFQGGGVPSLPAMSGTTVSALERVEDLLCLRLRQSATGAAITVPTQGPRIARAIAVHRKPVPLIDAFASQTPCITTLSRALPVRTKVFVDALASARSAMWGGAVPSFNSAQNLMSAWAVPNRNGHGPKPLIARELVMWAPEEMALPKAGDEKTALLYGEVVTHQRYGEFVWSCFLRRPELPVWTLPPVSNPLLQSMPSLVNFEADYYQFGDSRFHRIWSYVPRMDRLGDLQELDVDILTHVWSERGTLYCSMWLRASGETLEELREMEVVLQAFGRLEVVRTPNALGNDLERIFQSFVPGGLTPPTQNHFAVPSAKFLSDTCSAVGAVHPRTGNWCLGKSIKTHAPIFVHRADVPAVLVVAPPGQGKTTLTSVSTVLQGTPNTLFILLSPTAGEKMEKWVPEFFGQDIALDLPDAGTFDEQAVLFEKDAVWVAGFWKKLRAKWTQAKRPVGMPIYLHPKVKSLRFVRLAALFAEECRKSMAYVLPDAELPNFIIVWDDLVTALEVGRNLNLKSADGNRDLRDEVVALLKAEVWNQAHVIRKAAMNATEDRLRQWIQTFLIFHSRTQVEQFYPGLLGAMNLAIFVQRDTVQIFEPNRMIADPKDDAAAKAGLTAELAFDIPLPVVEMFGKPAAVGED